MLEIHILCCRSISKFPCLLSRSPLSLHVHHLLQYFIPGTALRWPLLQGQDTSLMCLQCTPIDVLHHAETGSRSKLDVAVLQTPACLLV